MPNEEILSALKNAIDHGESLQSAVQIMINSGYHSEEVYEASKFIGGGTLTMQETTPEEQLAMPEEKKKFKFWGKDKTQNQTPQIIQTPQPQFQQQPSQPIQPYSKQIQPITRPIAQPIKQLPQYSPQITQAQIKQSFQHPMQQYPQQQSQQARPSQQPIQQLPQYPPQPAQPYYPQQIPRQAPRPAPQLALRNGELSKEIQGIKPVKQGYLKEIVLLIILLILIGILAATILFKDTILGWFA